MQRLSIEGNDFVQKTNESRSQPSLKFRSRNPQHLHALFARRETFHHANLTRGKAEIPGEEFLDFGVGLAFFWGSMHGHLERRAVYAAHAGFGGAGCDEHFELDATLQRYAGQGT